MDKAHMPSDDSHSLLKLGSCQIPDCPCPQFLDEIKEIDEDLM